MPIDEEADELVGVDGLARVPELDDEEDDERRDGERRDERPAVAVGSSAAPTIAATRASPPGFRHWRCVSDVRVAGLVGPATRPCQMPGYWIRSSSISDTVELRLQSNVPFFFGDTRTNSPSLHLREHVAAR